MKCHEARRLFGAFWDDETTQAEREWLDAHFVSCGGCRTEYENFARTVEAVSALPRYDAAPELLDRTLARTRRAAPAHDALPQRRPAWVAATAAAAALVVGTALVIQWVGMGHVTPSDDRTVAATPMQTAPLGAPVLASAPVADTHTAAVADSVFDHSDDIEFVLDPVTLKRGRAALTHPGPDQIRSEQAVVSF
jgi:predicted anti-sigma-YlaC factor YlaD